MLNPNSEIGLRLTLGRLYIVFGLLHILMVVLARHGLVLSASLWSALFFLHFLTLTLTGLGLQALTAARTKLFYGGPFIDFLIGVGGFMVIESIAAALLRGSKTWPAPIPGLALILFGLRLKTGRPLLGSSDV